VAKIKGSFDVRTKFSGGYLLVLPLSKPPPSSQLMKCLMEVVSGLPWKNTKTGSALVAVVFIGI
jgi:hypothetical protein